MLVLRGWRVSCLRVGHQEAVLPGCWRRYGRAPLHTAHPVGLDTDTAHGATLEKLVADIDHEVLGHAAAEVQTLVLFVEIITIIGWKVGNWEILIR